MDLSQYGNGTVRGILSVDISDWEAPGVVYGKPARECSAEEIKDEVWTQLKQHLNDNGAAPIDDANLVAWFLDPDIEFPNPGSATNAEPLLINTSRLAAIPAGSSGRAGEFLPGFRLRPDVYGHRLHGGGQRSGAARGQLPACGLRVRRAAPAQLWPLEEPAFLKPLQEIDRIRFRLGRPHHLELVRGKAV